MIQTLVEEEYSDQARALVAQIADQKISVITPSLFQYELVSILRKLSHRKIISVNDGEAYLAKLLLYPMTLVFDDALHRRAYEIASQLNLPAAYDAQYLAVAERYECEFWTSDERLYNTVSADIPRIRWIAYFNLQTTDE